MRCRMRCGDIRRCGGPTKPNPPVPPTPSEFEPINGIFVDVDTPGEVTRSRKTKATAVGDTYMARVFMLNEDDPDYVLMQWQEGGNASVSFEGAADNEYCRGMFTADVSNHLAHNIEELYTQGEIENGFVTFSTDDWAATEEFFRKEITPESIAELHTELADDDIVDVPLQYFTGMYFGTNWSTPAESITTRGGQRICWYGTPDTDGIVDPIIYEVGDTSIANISNYVIYPAGGGYSEYYEGTIEGLQAGETTITFYSVNNPRETKLVIPVTILPPIAVESIGAPNTESIGTNVGAESNYVTFDFLPENASTVRRDVVITSSDESIATIGSVTTNNGWAGFKVVGVSAGECTVTYSLGSTSYTVNVSVAAAPSYYYINLHEDEFPANVGVGQTVLCQAEVERYNENDTLAASDYDSSIAQITFNRRTIKHGSWYSDWDINVTGLQVGETVAKIHSVNNPEVYDELHITVAEPAAVESVGAPSHNNVSLSVGYSMNIGFEYSPANAVDFSTIQTYSSDDGVATITGIVKTSDGHAQLRFDSVGGGECTLTYSAGNTSYDIAVTVTVPTPLESIGAPSEDNITIPNDGTEYQVTFNYLPVDAQDFGDFTCESSAPEIADIATYAENGVFTIYIYGWQDGECTITYSFGNTSYDIAVTVTEPQMIEEITIDNGDIQCEVGDTVTITGTYSPTNASAQELMIDVMEGGSGEITSARNGVFEGAIIMGDAVYYVPYLVVDTFSTTEAGANITSFPTELSNKVKASDGGPVFAFCSAVDYEDQGVELNDGAAIMTTYFEEWFNYKEWSTEGFMNILNGVDLNTVFNYENREAGEEGTISSEAMQTFNSFLYGNLSEQDVIDYLDGAGCIVTWEGEPQLYTITVETEAMPEGTVINYGINETGIEEAPESDFPMTFDFSEPISLSYQSDVFWCGALLDNGSYQFWGTYEDNSVYIEMNGEPLSNGDEITIDSDTTLKFVWDPPAPERCPASLVSVWGDDSTISIGETTAVVTNFTTSADCVNVDYSNIVATPSSNIVTTNVDINDRKVYVTGVSAGQCTITFSDGDSSWTFNVTVETFQPFTVTVDTTQIPQDCVMNVGINGEWTEGATDFPMTFTFSQPIDARWDKEDPYWCGFIMDSDNYQFWGTNTIGDTSDITVDVEMNGVTLSGVESTTINSNTNINFVWHIPGCVITDLEDFDDAYVFYDETIYVYGMISPLDAQISTGDFSLTFTDAEGNEVENPPVIADVTSILNEEGHIVGVGVEVTGGQTSGSVYMQINYTPSNGSIYGGGWIHVGPEAETLTDIQSHMIPIGDSASYGVGGLTPSDSLIKGITAVSSDDSVVTVGQLYNDAGTLMVDMTAVGEGNATVTVTLNDGSEYEMTVAVVDRWQTVVETMRGGIYHNAEDGIYYLTDAEGNNQIAISDINLNATGLWDPNDWDDSGTYGTWGGNFQWGNNYDFNLEHTTSHEQVDASTYGPSNPYNVNILITPENQGNYYFWDSSSNTNLWGYDDYESSGGEVTYMQGPCPEGWHVPSREELSLLLSLWLYIRTGSTSAPDDTTLMSSDLLLPMYDDGWGMLRANYLNVGNTTTPVGFVWGNNATGFYLLNGDTYNVRPFKDELPEDLPEWNASGDTCYAELQYVNETQRTLEVGSGVNIGMQVIECANTDFSNLVATSSDSNVATAYVDAEPERAQLNITGVAAGNCNISVTDGNNTYVVPVVVTAPTPPTYATISSGSENVTMAPGDNVVKWITYSPSDANTSNITWTDSDGNVAHGNYQHLGDGECHTLIDAYGEGTCTVTVSDGTNSYVYNVTVTSTPQPTTHTITFDVSGAGTVQDSNGQTVSSGFSINVEDGAEAYIDPQFGSLWIGNNEFTLIEGQAACSGCTSAVIGGEDLISSGNSVYITTDDTIYIEFGNPTLDFSGAETITFVDDGNGNYVGTSNQFFFNGDTSQLIFTMHDTSGGGDTQIQNATITLEDGGAGDYPYWIEATVSTSDINPGASVSVNAWYYFQYYAGNITGTIPDIYVESVGAPQENAIQINIGETHSVPFTYLPLNASSFATVAYSSSDGNVATAALGEFDNGSAQLNITGVDEGSATITIADGVNTYTINVTVVIPTYNIEFDVDGDGDIVDGDPMSVLGTTLNVAAGTVIESEGDAIRIGNDYYEARMGAASESFACRWAHNINGDWWYQFIDGTPYTIDRDITIRAAFNTYGIETETGDDEITFTDDGNGNYVGISPRFSFGGDTDYLTWHIDDGYEDINNASVVFTDTEDGSDFPFYVTVTVPIADITQGAEMLTIDAEYYTYNCGQFFWTIPSGE